AAEELPAKVEPPAKPERLARAATTAARAGRSGYASRRLGNISSKSRVLIPGSGQDGCIGAQREFSGARSNERASEWRRLHRKASPVPFRGPSGLLNLTGIHAMDPAPGRTIHNLASIQLFSDCNVDEGTVRCGVKWPQIPLFVEN